ncbi:MAG: L-rhamnose isomerase [Candidatus Marinimicrobia bacterium]|nr:L-rhamnose isomerase [Candidatus Neomarinimicrobiota bacterium]
MNNIEKSYELAKEQYSAIGIDAEKAIKTLNEVSISIHCWQADDVTGFEKEHFSSGGGIMATGNYPGKARNIDELRKDIEKVLEMVPGKHKLNLHAMYGDYSNGFPGRDKIETKHFESWIEWAKNLDIGLDFNSTFFSHPYADDGYTLSHTDRNIREYWIEHAKRCRSISNYIGEKLKKKCIHNLWIPDGSKDITFERFRHRELLKESLDEIFKEKFSSNNMADSVESKLFGIGSEAYVVGSHEFYLSYALKNNLILCIDNGHFHPTESCADKVSALFVFFDELLFHLTRGIRWDSDHIVILNDEVKDILNEIVLAGKLNKSHLALDFFDASINRIGAYVIGIRALQKAILSALLLPVERLREYERDKKYFQRLALFEETKTKPFGSVWNYYCYIHDVPVGEDYIKEIEKYENEVLSKRD